MSLMPDGRIAYARLSDYDLTDQLPDYDTAWPRPSHVEARATRGAGIASGASLTSALRHTPVNNARTDSCDTRGPTGARASGRDARRR